MKGTRCQGQNAGLIRQGRYDPGVAMALVDSRIAAQAVEIPFAIHIPDKDTGATVKDDRNGMIIMCAVSLLQLQVSAGQVSQRLRGR